jgi:RNA polymerase-binding protein DksA
MIKKITKAVKKSAAPQKKSAAAAGKTSAKLVKVVSKTVSSEKAKVAKKTVKPLGKLSALAKAAAVKKTVKAAPKSKSKPVVKTKTRTTEQLTAVNGTAKPPLQKLTKSPLTKDDLRHFEKVLLQKRSEVLRDLEIMRSMLDEANNEDSNSSYSMHMADHGTETMDKEQHFMFIQRDEKYLSYIDKALERIKHGTYGICKTTGKLIPKERLKLVPHTTQTVEAKIKR